MSDTLHPNEIKIELEVVSQLTAKQFPSLKNMQLKQYLSQGTDNVLFKLGDNMCVRLPRYPEAAAAILKEQQWLPHLGSHLSISIPKVIAIGQPDQLFPYPWSIYSWSQGTTALDQDISSNHAVAEALAKFILELQTVPIDEGAPNSKRGIPLQERDHETLDAFKTLHDIRHIDYFAQKWETCRQAPAWDKKPVWTHGDLLPTNVLVYKDRLASVIDFGMMGIGDPACDLLPAWSIFNEETRQTFRQALNVDDATWMRGLGWALSIALIIIPYYRHTKSNLTGIAFRILDEIIKEDD